MPSLDVVARGGANRDVPPPEESNSPAPPRVLILTEKPGLFRAIRAGLGATDECQGRSRKYYDEGLVRSRSGFWRVALPLDVAGTESLEVCIDDQRPSLLIVAIGAGSSDSLVVPSKVTVGEIGDVEMPRSVFDLLKRVRIRDQWPDLTSSSTATPTDVWLAQSRLSIDAFTVASRRGCPALAVLASDGWFAQQLEELSAFIAALLRNIDVSVIGPSSPMSGAVTAPPPKLERIPVYGAIARVEMRSLRMFAHLTWEAPEARAGWHVVLGDNASGKTSLLRAIALCLLDRSEREALRQSWSSWLRTNEERGAVTVTLQPDEAGAATTELALTLQRVPSPKPDVAASSVDVQSLERLVHGGFLAAYGPFRRFTGGDAEWVKGFNDHPRLQRVLTLFDERAALSDAIEWLKNLWVRARTITPTPPEDAFLKDLLAFINTTSFLPDNVRIEEPDADGVWCRDGNGLRVLVIDLSDGYRSMLSLALDLLRHLAAEYGHERVFAKTPALHVAVAGTVLIDEVDAHLHPQWQQRIGAWFKRCFPKVQFITATHSAIVCQAADSVLLLPSPGAASEPRMATPGELNRLRYGNLLDAYGTGVFGVGVEQSNEGRVRLDRLATLNIKELDEGLSADEEAERSELRAVLPSRAGAVRGRG